MTLTDLFNAYYKTHKIRIRPFDIESYKQDAQHIREVVQKILPNKKKSYLLYTYYLMSVKYPYLNFDDMAAALECTKTNVLIMSRKIKIWINTYEDVRTDLEFITFKLNQDATKERLFS